jgi:hypothetical protein
VLSLPAGIYYQYKSFVTFSMRVASQYMCDLYDTVAK